MDTVLSRGAYSFAEASRLTGLRPARVREWFRGRSSRTRPIFAGDYEPANGQSVISFLDVIDVFVAGQLREHGVSLQTLRRVHQHMQDDLRSFHPFCRRELLSDGKAVFLRGLDADGQEELTEVLTGLGAGKGIDGESLSLQGG